MKNYVHENGVLIKTELLVTLFNGDVYTKLRLQKLGIASEIKLEIF